MSVKFHFFGKDCIVDRAIADREDLRRALCQKGFEHDAIQFVNQIHSADVITIDAHSKVHGDQNLPKADAIITNLEKVVIGVFTADCAPIFLYDEEKKVVAVVHAGWKGAKSGVIKSTIAEMEKLGAKNIVAIIGPMIQQKSYEVSQEFFDDFTSEDEGNKIFFMDGEKAGKHMFDLPSYVEKKLREEGILEIENSGIDTYENEKEFFSYRRSTHRGEVDCGRNISVIVLG
ncbi:MAG: peptidoglycan editing factor PgeF [Pseudomonadota bacterium]